MDDKDYSGIDGSATSESVARGTADRTPAVAIAGTALIIAIVFVVALGLAALAYVFAT